MSRTLKLRPSSVLLPGHLVAIDTGVLLRFEIIFDILTSMNREMGGLYSGLFSGYRIATDEEIIAALRSAIVAVDANVLLNLYRYRDQTSNDLLSVFEKIDSRLVVPYQALREFWRHRRTRQSSPEQARVEMVKALESAENKITSALDVWSKKTGLSVDEAAEFRGQSSELIASLKDTIDEASAPVNRTSKVDEILIKLEEILEGKVGPRPDDEIWQSCVEEGAKRINNEEPPGYLDKRKEEYSSHPEGGSGDYLVWHQATEIAKSHERDLIIITGDEKEDWWWKDRGKFLGPRHELTREFYQVTGKRVFLMRPSEVLDLAGEALKLSLSASSMADATRIAAEKVNEEISDVELWTVEGVAALMGRLEMEAPIQAEALKFAALEGEGKISREKVFQLGGYEDDRMLRGFTRPYKRLTKVLQQEYLVALGINPIFVARYPEGVKASYFSVAEEIPELMRHI